MYVGGFVFLVPHKSTSAAEKEILQPAEVRHGGNPTNAQHPWDSHNLKF